MKLTVDLIIKRSGDILFVTRKFPPFQGMFALPGGFVEDNETTLEAAVRELKEETGLDVEPQHLRLVGTYSAPGRDPRGRVVTVAYACEVPANTEAVAGDDAAAAEWQPFLRALEMGIAFDHAQIIADAESAGV